MNYTYREFKALKKKSNQPLEVRIITNSMNPWIKAGSHVKVKVCPVGELKPYDIILFWRADKLVCHILKEIDSNFVITAPLNQPKGKKIEDPPTHESHVLGKVTEPKFGWLHKFLLRFTI